MFSAAGGSSSVQTFRIGKSITNSEDDSHVCSLAHDAGSCERKEFRYYYNSLERRCKLFVYGGCKGNQNNFVSEIDCLKRCGDESAIAGLPDLNTQPQLQEIDQCSQVKDEGICPGNVPRFYFDQSAQRCLLFSYGGCGGNTNNFLTEDSCIGTCGGPSGALIHAIQLHGGFKPRKPICNLPINRGGCQAKLRRFYFDSGDETCKLFVFGGCQGNENNFETMEACVVNCGGPSDHTTATFSSPTTPRSITLSTNISPPLEGLCSLPKEVGPCNIFEKRYYFDRVLQICRQFRFGGCGGNGNNFKTGANCQKNCGGSIEDIVQSKINSAERIVINSDKKLPPPAPPSSTRSPPANINFQSQALDETGLRKRKMKRVRISPKERLRSRGSSRKSHQLEERSLLLDSNVSNNDDEDSALDKAQTRAVLNRARLRSRTSSTNPRVNIEEVRQSDRKTRTISNLTALDLQYLGRGEESERVERESQKARRLVSLTAKQKRVDEVMAAPPNMRGGLVVIRSYCRYAPQELRRQYKCRKPSKFYFYNVASARCEALSGVCTTSENKFPTFDSCMKSCIVQSEDLSEEE